MEITPKDRRALIILGSIAAVALLLFVFVLHKGGSGTSSQTTTAAPASTGQQTPAPTPSPDGNGSNGGHGTKHHGDNGNNGSTDTSARDPFQPLVAESSTSTTTPVSPVVVPTSPSPSPEPSTSPSPSPSPGTEPSSIEHAGHTVTLVAITKQNGQAIATVQVDDARYNVKPGQDIVAGFKLLSISGSCADFLHVTHPFTLCVDTQTAK
jgi:hypothetical protein